MWTWSRSGLSVLSAHEVYLTEEEKMRSARKRFLLAGVVTQECFCQHEALLWCASHDFGGWYKKREWRLIEDLVLATPRVYLNLRIAL